MMMIKVDDVKSGEPSHSSNRCGGRCIGVIKEMWVWPKKWRGSYKQKGALIVSLVSDN